ncbi:ABC transporter permease [Alsobacter metallidurans]|uniref:ABC transporter permease n=1 Tax=Alsobacter metallidurans TaxID=340221 RepID=A0A917IC54_9HYPH|nr:sugar ABC transporter permease [Alsobacter metallidurans]GGH31746.1 ABC transporter permease [Alsobacter metallidurans]
MRAGRLAGSRNALTSALLLLPAAVLLWVFTYQPIVTTVIDSFFSTARGRRPSVFIGSTHYETMVADPVFWKALVNNAIYAFTTIPISMALALAMALFVSGKLRGRGIVRMAYFTPTVLPMVAVANIWLFFYTPDYGLVDQLLRHFGGGGANWLGSKETALGALIVITIWKEAGFFMIFYLAALQQISPTLMEAAALEGASPWQRFRRVTLPLLMPTTLFVSINAVIGAFRLVDHVIAMTRGGPDNATVLLLFYVYQVGFGYWDTGYAAALTVVLLAMLALIALFQFGYADKRVHYR